MPVEYTGMTGWNLVGKVSLDHSGPLRFPPVRPHPAVYRLLIRSETGQAVYVGETLNLRRLLGHVRNPGPSQATNKGSNASLIEALNQGGEVTVWTVSDVAATDGGMAFEEGELSSTDGRRRIKRAAIQEHEEQNYIILNRNRNQGPSSLNQVDPRAQFASFLANHCRKTA